MVKQENYQLASSYHLASKILALAAIYLLVGELGLLMAIAPGFASPVWPAAGISMAALLLCGPRLWPGILLGSFVLNLPGSIGSSTSIETITPLLIAASIGIGSSLQALIGAGLIRRYVDIDSGLLDTRSVLLFLGLGGPLSSLVGACWGVGTLALAQVIEVNHLTFSWITWWAGDCLGVLFMLPLVFILFARPRSMWAPRKLRVAVPLIVTVAAVTVVFLVSSNQQQEQVETRFDSFAQMLGDSLEKKASQDFEVLYSLQQLFTTATSASRRQFNKYVERALARNPSIYALSWNPVVAHSERAAFEQAMRAEGFAQFTLSERSAAGQIVPAAVRDHYVVVHYIEPLQANRKVLGFDIYSNAERKLAVDQASSSGQLTASAPLNLVQDAADQVGVLFMLPVYGDRDTQTQPPQRELPDGIVVGVFRSASLLQNAHEVTSFENVNLRMTDISETDNPRPLASYRVVDGQRELLHDADQIKDLDGILKWQKTIRFGNRSWLLEVFAPPAFFTDHRSWTAWGILLVGLLFAALLGSFLMILTGRTIVDQQRADDLSVEIFEREKIEVALQEANETLEEIASTDLLTRIANRRATETYAARLNSEARRYSSSYAVLMLDIDHFKDVNDRWGHKIGDQVLQEFVERIRASLRDVDFFGRWGGEEFIILSRNTSLQETSDFAERICQVISAQEFEPVGNITTSIGVAEHHAQESYEELIQRADRALYRAKHSGRNRIVVDQENVHTGQDSLVKQ